MVRKPVVSGMFYADNTAGLDEQIKECFEGKFGPGSLPVERRDKKIIGVIAPHAGYQFSGAGQAWCYKEIGESEFADRYIILGTTHIGFPTAAVMIDKFETPYGKVEVDEKFVKSLFDKGAVIENKLAHQNEHSIEVQLPFLQFVNKEKLKQLKIVPIVVGRETDYGKVGKAIATTIKQFGGKTIIICSSDFTHYGVHYGYIPFRNAKDKLKDFDMEAIKWIKKLDSWSFITHVNETEATICGAYAIAVFIEVCKELGAKKVDVVNYYNSGDIVGDYSNAVGYASIIVE
jgi:hypothetical protein